MKKNQMMCYFSTIVMVLWSTHSFGMMLEDEFGVSSTPNTPSFAQKSDLYRDDLVPSTSTSPQKEEVNYDKALASIHGKNKSSFPLSEKMYAFILSKVGKENKRPFIFKTGPQILFEDEIDVLK